ncbi:hypothetical protein [Mailhella massiliensis]|uniref:hypothetical protein n=2 Tax=Mailhella massiliensis TaxID=1903261 RepID=UPI00097D2E53|nr:hypothetical protein [Mailhella massiliensis]
MKLSLLFTASALALLFACTPKVPVSGHTELPGRPGPAYIQWLEEQACLRRAGEVTSVVSGSSLNWRCGSRTSLLPQTAGTWFRASPALTAWTGQGSFLSALARKNTAEELASLGIRGLYLSGMADTGDEWKGRSPACGLGEDATGLSLGRTAGGNEEYDALLASLAGAELLAGGTMPPAHTGMGPDFFLALRAVRDYPGLYAMLEVPGELQHVLPDLAPQEQAALSSAETDALAARGLMAPALVQDAPGFAEEARGWAATGPVVGVDGVKRRWIYRWYASPERPVLYWDDPSGAARRIMEAALIEQAGLRHQALVGLHAAAWMGLDAVSPGETSTAKDNLEPGLSALSTLSRNAHRYGAALLMEDSLPMERLAALQRSGVDFCFDSVLFPSLEKSLLLQNADPVRRSLRRSLRLGVDHKALWRAAADGLPRRAGEALLPLMPEGWASLLTPQHGQEKAPRISAPALAAASLRLPPGKAPEQTPAYAVEDAHMLQIAARAFLPGLLMISGSDLSGALPLGEDWPATPPLWQMDPVPASRRGLPSGLALYRRPGSDAKDRLRTMITARENCGISKGRLTLVPDCAEQSVLVTVSVLPSGASLVFFGNFSENGTTVAPEFSLWDGASSRVDLLTGKTVSPGKVTLSPLGWRAVLLR